MQYALISYDLQLILAQMGWLGNHWLYPEGDGFQRSLVPRSRFQPLLTPSVRHEFHQSGKEVRQQ
jgi:hypothetical protein